MPRSSLKKSDSPIRPKHVTTIGSTMTPDRTPSARQLLQKLEKQEEEHQKQFQEMRSFYEEKLIRYDAMQVRYMAAREQQESLINRIKKLEKDLDAIKDKKEKAEAELMKEKSNRLQQMNEQFAGLQKDLTTANQLIHIWETTSDDLEKRVDSLTHFAERILSVKKKTPKVKADSSKNHPTGTDVDMISSDSSSSSSDSDTAETVVIIDNEDDSDEENKENERNAQNDQSTEETQINLLRKRKKTVENKLKQLTSLIKNMQKNMSVAKSQLKMKLSTVVTLQQDIKRLQIANNALKEKCEQLEKDTTKKGGDEMKKLVERLHDLESISQNALKSVESSASALSRIDNQRSEYRQIFNTSIEDIDQLCLILKEYLHSKSQSSTVHTNGDTEMETEHCTALTNSTTLNEIQKASEPSDMSNAISSQKPSSSSGDPSSQTNKSSIVTTDQQTTTISESAEAISPSDAIGNNALKEDKLSNKSCINSLNLSDCSILTLSRTSFLEMEDSPGSDACKTSHQMEQTTTSSVTSEGAPPSKITQSQWLCAKRTTNLH
ncbi:unnamed protein product [Anisakis simplex]|uniref:Cilia- and flagella-associated protein 157 n=1 Tax=Anisakis simplex TaxID=6269 RepID=A0A158PMQ6_ANISI|nr:unnamed protein product [Anisakis simplex]